MVIAKALTGNNEELLLIGLSTENRARLAAGEPIDLLTHVGEGHQPLHIVIFAGDTEDSMQAQLFPLFDARTKVVNMGAPQ